MPADDSYLDKARAEGLVEEVVPLARMQAVVAVPKGNPKGIDALDDLLAPDLRLAQASPDATAIGKLTREVLDRDGHWSTLDAATDVYKTTVNEVANDVKVGAADAGIVFDAVLATYPDLEAVELPELAPVASRIAVGVLDRASSRPAPCTSSATSRPGTRGSNATASSASGRSRGTPGRTAPRSPSMPARCSARPSRTRSRRSRSARGSASPGSTTAAGSWSPR